MGDHVARSGPGLELPVPRPAMVMPVPPQYRLIVLPNVQQQR